MFVPRDTGAQNYFGVPLVKSQEIFRGAYQRVSGLARTVRGPSMSANPGKIQVLGIVDVGKKKAIALRFLQGRNPDWVQKPFLAKYDEKAIWIDELKPFTGKKFFYEDNLDELLSNPKSEKYLGKEKTKKLKKKVTRIATFINKNNIEHFEDKKGIDWRRIGRKNFS